VSLPPRQGATVGAAGLMEELERPTLKASLNETAQKAMTYNFKIVVEPDEDFDGNPAGWHTYCPF
jgi:hypothetical protein